MRQRIRFGKQIATIRRQDGRISVSTFTGNGWIQKHTYSPFDVKRIKREQMDYLERVGYVS